MVGGEGAIPFHAAAGAARKRHRFRVDLDVRRIEGAVVVEPLSHEGRYIVIFAAMDQTLGQIPVHMEAEMPEPRGRRLPLGPAGKRHVEDGEMRDSPSMKGRLRQRHHAADVVSAHGIAFVSEGDHDFVRVARHRRLVVAAERAVGKARAAQVHGHHAETLGQQRHHVVPFPPCFRPAVKQKDRRA